MNRLSKFLLSTVLSILGFTTSSFGSIVDTVTVYSESMKKQIKTVVIYPDSYQDQGTKKYPVLYLLHGYSGDYSTWVNSAPGIKQLSDQYQMMIVCPDGAYSSWYINSPIDSSFRYETFTAIELVSFIDKKYRTIGNRDGRAITGFSMGGHGGLFLGFRHQDVYGACGSSSGGVDIRPFPKNWHLSKRLGEQNVYPRYWEEYTVINQVNLLSPDSLQIIIDCGTEDFFYEVNVNLHNRLLKQKISHDFISSPGSHNWDYWRNSIKYQCLFFNNFFSSKK